MGQSVVHVRATHSAESDRAMPPDGTHDVTRGADRVTGNTTKGDDMLRTAGIAVGAVAALGLTSIGHPPPLAPLT